MSIGSDSFASEGLFTTYDPYHTDRETTVNVFLIQCHDCGFEPEGHFPPSRCPKCGHTSWERLARPGSILANSQRYSEENLAAMML